MGRKKIYYIDPSLIENYPSWTPVPFDEDQEDWRDKDPQEAFQKLSQKYLRPFRKKGMLWRCHIRDQRRCFYWAWKYEFYGSLFAELKRNYNEFHLKNKWMSELFAEMALELPRWKKLTPEQLINKMHNSGNRIPRWQRGPRASFLLHLFLDEPVYRIAVTIIALEEGKSPHTIYKGIKQARAIIKTRKVKESNSQ